MAILTCSFRGPNGESVDGKLFDPGPGASETELLRTVAKHFGVKWGHDEFGWWAAVPDR